MSARRTDFTPAEVARDDHSTLLLSLRFLRGERSLDEIAGLAGIRADELSRIERGLTKQIRWETLMRLMRTYDCRPDDLLAIEDTSSAAQGTPRDLMLAAMNAGVGESTPLRRVHLDEASTGLAATAETALAATVQRGPIHRKFKPAGAH